MKRRYLKKMGKTDLLVLLFFVVVFCISLLFVRPMQDDYVALRDMSSVGLQDSVYNMWNTWGGNISTIAISNFCINLYFDNHFFLGIALHSIITLALFLSSVRILMRYFQEITKAEIKIRTSTWLLLSFLCLGSLHTPGYISVLNFTLAASAHLWPTLIFVHAIYLARSKKKIYLPLLLLLGFLTGNFNVSESIFCLGTTLVIGLFSKSSSIRYLRVERSNLLVLVFGQLIGLLTIVLAPGFQARSKIVLQPKTFEELIYNFVQALAYNLGDILLHPGWFLALLVGLTIDRGSVPRESLFNYLKLNSFVLVICVLTVSAGGAFAYPSWYHTISFYVFVFPVFFTVGLVLRGRHGLPIRTKLSAVKNLGFFLCAILLIRDLTMMGIRAEHWDRDFAINSLKISNNQVDLVGYNINYWPLGLGVDDVEKWDWINSAYVDWVQNTKN
jgi:hypothetical protein